MACAPMLYFWPGDNARSLHSTCAGKTLQDEKMYRILFRVLERLVEFMDLNVRPALGILSSFL